MKRALFSLIMIFTGAALFADALDDLLDGTLSKIQNLPVTPYVVSFGNLTFGEHGLASPFSRYLEEKLKSAVFRNPRLRYFAREKLEEIVKAQELSVSDLVAEHSAVRLGNLEGMRGLIHGTYVDRGKYVSLFLLLTDIEKGTAVFAHELEIPKSLIDPGIAFVPQNYEQAVRVLDELSEIQNSQNANLRIKVWTPRGDGGTYRVGENLEVYFAANMDCYIKIYHIDVKGRLQLIFPNPYHKANFIGKNTVYRIPDGSYGFTFLIEEPLGTEFIKVIASTVPFKDTETAFEDQGSATREKVTKGLSVQATQEMISEAMISHLVVK